MSRYGETMIPGELFIKDGELVLNEGRRTVTLHVANSGDRPIQVGSHYHFFETNNALSFDRDGGAAASGWIFRPAQRCASSRARAREVHLVAYAGTGTVYGFQGRIQGESVRSVR